MDVEAIARGLSEAQREFLVRVCDGRRLGLADRQEDRVRQKMRRMGLVFVAKEPRRWEARPLGQQVREVLLRDA